MTDVVIVGSSPNALVAAVRLARGGKGVVVVEPDARVGGPVMTEEFAPGFLGNTGMPTAPVDVEILNTLGIEVDFGVTRVSETRLGDSSPTLISVDATFASAVGIVMAIDRVTPPALAEAGSSLASIGEALRGMGAREMHEVLRLLFMSVRDYCAETRFSESEQLLLAGAALRGRAAGPFAPGTLFGAIRHGAHNDLLATRQTVRGSVRQLPQAIADAAASAGASIRTGAGKITIDTDGGVATGVTLASGERIAANAVLSDFDARATFTRLMSPADLEPEHKRSLRSLRYRGTVARIQLALRDLPQFSGVDRYGHATGLDALRGTLVVAESLADLERNWDEAKRGAIPSKPYIEVAIPTLADPSLAPAGQHVVDLWVQHVPYSITDRAAVLSRVLDALAPHAPNLADLVIHHHVALPRDLEARFGLTEGHLYGGELSLEQSFLFRPFSGCTGYQTPIRGLYLCGSAAHPGGYTGRSGWNLAGDLLA